MLYTRNAFHFRKFYKEEVARERSHIDLNFVGSLHPDKSRNETGFAKLIYGNREGLGKILGSIALNVAADDQAIYELIQNADDCKSSFFSVSYNENYLLCINNGNYFSDRDMSAIINVAGNYKDGEDIGTFGIGFKILHRLVGADDGREAIINDYAGPIIFSWNSYFQLKKFIDAEPIFVSGIGKAKENYDYERDRSNPWLVKLLYTCFPSNYKEPIRLGDYDTRDVKFDQKELAEMREFLSGSLQNVNLAEDNYLKNGSIFFLRLGEGKSKFLDEGIDKIKSGLSYSFKFLNSLNKIYINGDEIKANPVLDYSHSFPIDSQKFGDINPKNKNRDIKFTFAYYSDYKKAVDLQNELAPNLYTFFSMDEEKNGFSFLLHCNAFDMNNDRRKLQANSQINEKLLPIIANDIITYANTQKENNRILFLSLYSNFLLSKIPKNKPHIDNSFFKFIHQYIIENIPTKNGFSDNAENVKINKLNTQLSLGDFGLNHIQWFEWKNETDRILLEEAIKEEKLGLKEWDIRDIVENANLESIDIWIASCTKENLEAFLKEIEDCSYLRKETKERICEIKLFKFSNNQFYSFNDCISSPVNLKTSILNNRFFNTHTTNEIRSELIKLGLVISEISTYDYPNIFSSVTLPEDKKHYDLIAEKCKSNTLPAEEKKKLFLNFINEATKFDNVGAGTLKDLQLFCNNNTEIKPLYKLINHEQNVPNWLNTYKVKSDEYFPELKPYLAFEQETLYKEIYLPNQDIISPNITEANEIKSLIKLYQDNQKQFFKEFIIKKVEHSFLLLKKTANKYQVQSADQQARSFIDKNCADNLFVLPYDFLDYKEEDGIIKADDLHSSILDFVEVTEHKEVLVNIVKYKAKSKLLQKLSEFKFNPNQTYSKEDYEFKILDLICSEFFASNNFNQQSNFRFFRNKLVIETAEQNFKYSEIPPVTDKVKIGNKEYSLSNILPTTYQNSNLISDLISHFSKQGLSSEKLNALFGVNEELDVDDIFGNFLEQTETIENPDQFFFLIYYHIQNRNADLSLLKFDLNCAVYPSKYALEKEILPEYILNWIKGEEVKLSELEKIGVWTEKSVVVELRKFLKDEINEFQNNRLAQETRFNDNETALFNSFEWLKEKEIKLTNSLQFETLRKVVEVINGNRIDNGDLVIEEEFYLRLLEENSTDWKEVDNHKIYLHDGEMPKYVGLDEIEDYIFYQYYKGDYAINGNSIYLNSKIDLKKTMQKIAADDDNRFTFENLWSLYGEQGVTLDDFDEQFREGYVKVREHWRRLPNRGNISFDDYINRIFDPEIQNMHSSILDTESDNELSLKEQNESNREAREIVKEKLEKEGFIFNQGIGEFSTINGVSKDDIEYPIVVKSYQYQNEPLKIGVNEWMQLIRPNSMFWVHFGNGHLGCLKINELLRSQDKLTISFDTSNLENEDKINQFSQILRYFKKIHFNFDTIQSSDYSVANDLSDYRFDERETEGDLSADDESIL